MRVLISGAGLGGLALAVALRRLLPSADVEIVERDETPQSPGIGYSITLDGDGLGALDRLALTSAVDGIASPVGSLRFLRPSGKRLLELKPAPSGRARRISTVTRAELRAALLDELPADTVRWGLPVNSYAVGAHTATAILRDGSSTTADLLVASDGARSPARSQLAGRQLEYLGMSRVEGVAPSVDDTAAGPGPFMTLGIGCSFFCQRLPCGGVLWSFAIVTEEGRLRDQPRELVRSIVEDAVRSWHYPIPAAVSATAAEDIEVRGTYDLPPLDCYRYGRVFLLGDAAHAMSPYRGRGANMALRDAVDLAEALVEADSIDRAGQLYQERSERRNRAAVLGSRRAATTLHASGALGRFARDAGLRATDAFLRLRSR